MSFVRDDWWTKTKTLRWACIFGGGFPFFCKLTNILAFYAIRLPMGGRMFVPIMTTAFIYKTADWGVGKEFRPRSVRCRGDRGFICLNTVPVFLLAFYGANKFRDPVCFALACLSSAAIGKYGYLQYIDYKNGTPVLPQQEEE